jgi:mono/diheme cytochrome c family protein
VAEPAVDPRAEGHHGVSRIRHRVVAALLAIPVLAVLVAAAVYAASEWRLRDVKPAAGFTLPIPTDPGALERGRHIAQTRGCAGCHGERLEGHDFGRHFAPVERAVAPNLAAHARAHDAATLEAAIRQGIGADGRALWVMPSYNFARLQDEDVAALIAYLRSLPVIEEKLPEPRLGWTVRWQIVTGQEAHMVDWVADVPSLRVDAETEPALARGEYLAMTTCNECHGLDLRGAVFPGDVTPDLAIVSAYPEEDFRRLLRTGVGIGGRGDLGLMSEVAKERFAHFTEQEFTDLRGYLLTLPHQPVPPKVPWRRLDD